MGAECGLASTGSNIVIIAGIALLCTALAIAVSRRVFNINLRDITKLLVIAVTIGSILLPIPVHALGSTCESAAPSNPSGTTTPSTPSSPTPRAASVPQPASTSTTTYNYFTNPRAIAGLGDWSAGNGQMLSYRTGSAIWGGGTTTDVATDTSGTLVYYKSDYTAMPAGTYQVSLDFYVSSAGNMGFVTHWFDAQGNIVAGPTIDIKPVTAGVNHIVLTTTTKPAGATDFRLGIVPQGYGAGGTIAATNLGLLDTTDTYFSGATAPTSTASYRWVGTPEKSFSEKVTSPVPSPVITSADLTQALSPTISGTAQPNTTVVVWIDNYGYSASVGSDGKWSITVSKDLLNNTTYPVKVTATDASNRTSMPATQQLVVQTAGVASGQFYTRKGLMYDPSGNVFVPIGANVGTRTVYDFNGNATNDHLGYANGHSDAAQAWGWNMIRLNLLVTDGSPTSFRTLNGYDAFKADVKSIVDEYTAKHIVVMLESHDLFFLNESEQGMNAPHLAQVDQFWKDMAIAYKDNPYVWFNLNNELQLANQQWVDINLHQINIVRSNGARNVIVIDTPSVATDASADNTPGAKYSFDPTMGPVLADAANGNLVMSTHNYGRLTNASDMNTYVGQLRAVGLPLVFGEFGYASDGSSTGNHADSVAAANTVMDNAQAAKVGQLWWNASFGFDKYSLKVSSNAFWADGGAGNNLSPAGTKYWSLTH